MNLLRQLPAGSIAPDDRVGHPIAVEVPAQERLHDAPRPTQDRLRNDPLRTDRGLGRTSLEDRDTAVAPSGFDLQAVGVWAGLDHAAVGDRQAEQICFFEGDVGVAEVGPSACDGDEIAPPQILHPAPAFEAVVATDPDAVRERPVDAQSGGGLDPLPRIDAVVVPAGDAIGRVRPGDAIGTPGVAETTQAVRPHPRLRIDALSKAGGERD